jgi:hypothetical protein
MNPAGTHDAETPNDLERLSPHARELVARVAGYILLLAFFGLGASSNGLMITFRGELTTSSPGELNFWLGHSLLLCPATLLLGYGYAAQLGPLARSIAALVRGLSERQRRLGILGLTLLAIAGARLGRAIFLLDLPVTDDEYAVDFGGRILASGHVMARLAVPGESIPSLFLYFKDGAVGSFDWIGGQAVAAIGELTRLGSLVWALLAATPVAVLAVLMRRRLGAPWGFAAALLFLCSPMAALLSMTTHAHLASRAFLALALLAFSTADSEGRFSKWTLTGCLLGLTFLCRPLETAFFSAPIAVWAAVQTARRAPLYRHSLAGLAVGFIPVAALLAWHAYAMTGNPLLPARFAAPGYADVTSASLWGRFGDNMSYNVLMLAVWFLGPLGLILVSVGALTDRFTRLLGLCVTADLCLALFHDNSGLHIVGPIHYSECAVPLTIIATHGLANLLSVARRHAVDTGRLIAAVGLSLALGLGTVTFVQALALRNQAVVQRTVYRAIERGVQDPGGRRAIVLAPWFFAVVNGWPEMRETGTWVHDWRRPRLDLEDAVLFLRDAPGTIDPLRARFPDRLFFRVEQRSDPQFLQIVPLDGGTPRPLDATP